MSTRLAGALGLILAAQVFAGDYIQERGGLSNAFQTFTHGEGEKRVVYFGGSITAGAGASKPELCYRSLLQAHLRQLYPKNMIFETNAAIGGTTSWLGAFRVRSDVQDHWIPATLTIVEFAVNDGDSPESRVMASMEGIVRQVRRAYPKGDILFVYTFVKGHLDDYKKGEVPKTIQWHEKVAECYGIPSVNLSQYIAAKIQAGELTADDFAKDGVHPTDKGYALYLEALKPLIAKWKTAAEQTAEIKPYTLPGPLSPKAMDKAKMVSYDRVKLDDKWKVGQASPVDKFLHVLAGDTPGATITLKFKGDCVGYFDALGPDTGDLEFSLDGGPWQPKPNWDVWAKGGFRPHCRVIVEDLDGNTPHELKVRIAEKQPAESKGRFFRPAFFLINGDLTEDPYKGMNDLQRIDAIYSNMEPVKFVPKTERWKFIPKAMQKLQDGPELRIVMLGDSIIGDTSSSRYEKVIERMYPKCKVVKVTSTRGSTGCWWYKDENRVQEWALKHKPDLLMIGGISQRDDIEAIREVIKQVRAGAPEIEVMLMTPIFGRNDPVKDADWSIEVDPNANSYRTKLMKLAADEKCEFLDMTGPWGQYIRESTRTMGWFKRDPIHANERGSQILGRILEKYFSPK
ncbi:MAG TPA: SGNH/GDSL hydrolase family protein [Planctomycetota bacterium]|jgi:lysophospholipase L1-like esterase